MEKYLDTTGQTIVCLKSSGGNLLLSIACRTRRSGPRIQSQQDLFGVRPNTCVSARAETNHGVAHTAAIFQGIVQAATPKLKARNVPTPGGAGRWGRFRDKNSRTTLILEKSKAAAGEIARVLPQEAPELYSHAYDAMRDARRHCQARPGRHTHRGTVKAMADGPYCKQAQDPVLGNV